MKKFIFMIVLLLPLISFANQDSTNKDEKKITGTTATFKGRIITIANNQIEVKKGSFEITFQLNDSIQVEKDGKPLTIKDLKICQLVKIEYVKQEETRTISKIIIIQESYCTE